jgi:DNA-binding XRE family transcriptional regulator
VASSKDIDEFIKLFRQDCVDATVAVDAPDNPNGEWWLDIVAGKFVERVAWRPAFGFGIFTSENDGFGDRPDEVYRRPEDASARLLQLLTKWRQAATTERLHLKDLRELIGTQQTKVAAALDISQAAVSRLESRNDMLLSTLSDYVEAMGGDLSVHVRFKHFEARLEPERGKRRKARK